ncbi:MAG TPA: DUF433 domain-containing protein [Anaerolineae bacterium]|nr:DUF433 domain-containing protein [Anaerolineae bacterium]HQH37139.1 DUF433 domain-containing protein [Anaerolineae bacterium]
MQLEDYFDFLADDDIRLKNTRVGIESVLYEYIYREQTPEAIHQQLPALTLEQIYATILYYLHNREQVEAYLADWLEWGQTMREAQSRSLPPFVGQLRDARRSYQYALGEPREPYIVPTRRER